MKTDIPQEIQLMAEHQAAFCRVLGNPQRIMILWLLAERERSVSEIALAIGASLQNTSQHLRIMGFNNLVESRREHQNVYYHLAENDLTSNCLVFTNRPTEIHLEVSPFKSQ
jgi:DNA-binding transcriptional ArsR family regulator